MISVDMRSQCRLVHQPAHGKVSHHQAVELLTHEVGLFAAQNDSSAAQMRLKFIQSGFDLPPLLVKGSQFVSRRLLRVESVRPSMRQMRWTAFRFTRRPWPRSTAWTRL